MNWRRRSASWSAACAGHLRGDLRQLGVLFGQGAGLADLGGDLAGALDQLAGGRAGRRFGAGALVLAAGGPGR